jgi:hypothetical protein
MRLPLPRVAETNETIAEISLKSTIGYAAVRTWFGGGYAETVCPSCPSDDRLWDRFGRDDHSYPCSCRNRNERARLLSRLMGRTPMGTLFFLAVFSAFLLGMVAGALTRRIAD